ncbi:hypothetical protein L7F22_053989 [Adiantum nelumboides]|nr:hypothetical protein [Adiantum nelumboides]
MSATNRQRNTPGPIAVPLGDHGTNILGRAYNGPSSEDAFTKVSDHPVKHTLNLGGSTTPVSADSQNSTDVESACETLSDVCLSSSASSSKSTGFSELPTTVDSQRSRAMTNSGSANMALNESGCTPQASPSKHRSKVPSLDVIAARLKRADLSLSPTFADQENGGHAIAQQQTTPVKRLPFKASANSTPIAERRPTPQRGRSDVLASLVDRASNRSRSASPVKRQAEDKREDVAVGTASVKTNQSPEKSRRSSVTNALKEVPSLQDIIRRMGMKKEGSTSTHSSPSMETVKSPPRTPVEKIKSVMTQTDSKEEIEAAQKKSQRAERMKGDEHPLEHKWTLYFDSKTWNPSTSQSSSDPPKSPALSASSSSATSWEATLKMLGQYDTVEKFMTTFRTLRRPSQLERNSNYHLFKNNIKPMWEDPANTKGGKWTITLRGSNQALLDRSWMWLVLALIGENIDEADDICGAVVSTRTKGDRIALWIRDKSNVDLVNKIGRKFVSVLDLEKESGVSLEFSANMQDESMTSSKSANKNDFKSSSNGGKYIGFSNPMQPASQSVQQQHMLNATHPGSPIQTQGTLGAHLRLHGSPSKSNLSNRRRDGSFSSHRQDPDSSVGSMNNFTMGLGGPIGRTSSPSPAPPNSLRKSASNNGIFNRNSAKAAAN